METLFATGHAADIVLAALLLEALWLRWRGWRLGDLLTMLLPAALIVVGLRAALVGAEWPWISVPIALSFPVHIADVMRRRRSLP
ncbi:hypothetical protein [Novosphingobium jiangmenense]|uniref:Uncharacterized protein n=1 Tax=Novosphingobium jiangmenense TaxID=2791981 RepID=A0ABS0HKX7_9SPHN|nr:hypothetical protein [Novosphingobium jiangmenense]MBF9152892.1 hypothetical protein [Novosphingobium jiangmenense]